MKALLVCTNQSTFPTKAGKTGLWLSELTHFYDEFTKRRIPMDFVSPLGGKVPLDERSLDLKDDTNRTYYEDAAFRQLLESTLKPADIVPQDYRLIYFTGGHGTMWDFPDNAELQAITRQIYEGYGMVAAVAHGVSALLNVTLSDGTPLVKDKYLTGFSNVEDRLVSFVSEVPFSLEDQLTARGAHFTKSLIPFVQYIEVDERLVTGQNPNSARKVARKVLEEISEK
jgi:putative intracellular protease/amidase